MALSKLELVTHVAEQTGATKIVTQKFVEAFLDGITGALSRGEDVRIIGFGTFSVQQTKAREGINPRTKEKIQIKASKRPTFKAGSELKTAVNGA